MKNIPLTSNYNQDLESILGSITLVDSEIWKLYEKNPEAFSFEPAYLKKEDGTVELLEISLVLNQKAPSLALDDMLRDVD